MEKVVSDMLRTARSRASDSYMPRCIWDAVICVQELTEERLDHGDRILLFDICPNPKKKNAKVSAGSSLRTSSISPMVLALRNVSPDPTKR